jgi:hypothetical protein
MKKNVVVYVLALLCVITLICLPALTRSLQSPQQESLRTATPERGQVLAFTPRPIYLSDAGYLPIDFSISMSGFTWGNRSQFSEADQNWKLKGDIITVLADGQSIVFYSDLPENEIKTGFNKVGEEDLAVFYHSEGDLFITTHRGKLFVKEDKFLRWYGWDVGDWWGELEIGHQYNCKTVSEKADWHLENQKWSKSKERNPFTLEAKVVGDYANFSYSYSIDNGAVSIVSIASMSESQLATFNYASSKIYSIAFCSGQLWTKEEDY